MTLKENGKFDSDFLLLFFSFDKNFNTDKSTCQPFCDRDPVMKYKRIMKYYVSFIFASFHNKLDLSAKLYMYKRNLDG